MEFFFFVVIVFLFFAVFGGNKKAKPARTQSSGQPQSLWSRDENPVRAKSDLDDIETFQSRTHNNPASNSINQSSFRVETKALEYSRDRAEARKADREAAMAMARSMAQRKAKAKKRGGLDMGRLNLRQQKGVAVDRNKQRARGFGSGRTTQILDGRTVFGLVATAGLVTYIASQL